jgi:hypothetical protein
MLIETCKTIQMVRDKPNDFVLPEQSTYSTLVEVEVIFTVTSCSFVGCSHVGSVGIRIVTKETKFGSKKSISLQLVLQS